jgi:hypothetical protein
MEGDYRPPEVRALPGDGQKDLREVPLDAWSGMLPTQLMGIHLPEVPAPRAHGLIGQDHSALQPQLFDIPKAQTKAE